MVALDADNQPSPEVPLIAGIDATFGVGCAGGVAPSCGFDPNGRITVFQQGVGESWVDPVSGDIEHIDLLTEHPTGQRYFDDQTTTTGVLYDADGHATPIQYAAPDASTLGAPVALVGDVFYYRDPQNDLIEIPPSDVPERLATEVTYFRVLQTMDGPLLALTRTTSDPSGTQSLLEDPSTGTQTVLPFDASNATISPDGRWVLTESQDAAGQFTFFDRASGAQQEVAVYGQAIYEPVWRPGTSEAWLTATDARQNPTVWVLRPDAPAVSVPGVAQTNAKTAATVYLPFTDDGAYWFADEPSSSPDAATEVVEIGAASDPTGPREPLNPPSTFMEELWPLPDGRFLTAHTAKDENRSDFQLFDPRTGDSHAVGERGLLAAAGETRFLGIFRVGESRGDLTALRFDAGTSTVLAPEFAVTAFAEPQGADLLAPGTRIVYQFQARTASPYDGIWVAACP